MKPLFKKKSDEKVMRSMMTDFHVSVDIDSSIEDSELPAHLKDKFKTIINSENTQFVVTRVIRDGEGIIDSLSFGIKVVGG